MMQQNKQMAKAIQPGNVTPRGFTLIELLVVIAIIAILAAILFPVFAQARSKARQTACLSNLKQIGTASNMYLQDFDECFPNHKSGTGATAVVTPLPDGRGYAGYVDWPLRYYPYIKNINVFVCPEDQDPKSMYSDNGTSNPYAPSGGYGKPVPLSYVENGHMWDITNATSVADIKFVSSTYWIGDGNSSGVFGFYRYEDTTVPQDQRIYKAGGFNRLRISNDCKALVGNGGNPYLAAGADPYPCIRHNGGNNIVFCDGHAKWENYKAMIGEHANPARITD